MSEKEIKTLLLRLPMATYEKVRQAASDNQIPITHFIAQILEGVEGRPMEARIEEIEKKIAQIEKDIQKLKKAKK
ncbi:MAG: hypothetical protein IJQ31_15135 [Thermoguttaceae bacterium]|nr:hypothetical protein [Thermoguttaceae bacterium]